MRRVESLIPAKNGNAGSSAGVVPDLPNSVKCSGRKRSRSDTERSIQTLQSTLLGARTGNFCRTKACAPSPSDSQLALSGNRA